MRRKENEREKENKKMSFERVSRKRQARRNDGWIIRVVRKRISERCVCGQFVGSVTNKR